jgi:hypothetical protein
MEALGGPRFNAARLATRLPGLSTSIHPPCTDGALTESYPSMVLAYFAVPAHMETQIVAVIMLSFDLSADLFRPVAARQATKEASSPPGTAALE